MTRKSAKSHSVLVVGTAFFLALMIADTAGACSRPVPPRASYADDAEALAIAPNASHLELTPMAVVRVNDGNGCGGDTVIEIVRVFLRLRGDFAEGEILAIVTGERTLDIDAPGYPNYNSAWLSPLTETEKETLQTVLKGLKLFALDPKTPLLKPVTKRLARNP